MIDGDELIDRFGEVDFLHQLWAKARAELPRRVGELRPLALKEEVSSPEQLGKRLHKLRGLIANFLTEKRAVDKLIECETAIENERLDDLARTWPDFERLLFEEADRLDTWLTERGYPVL